MFILCKTFSKYPSKKIKIKNFRMAEPLVGVLFNFFFFFFLVVSLFGEGVFSDRPKIFFEGAICKKYRKF